MQLTAQSVDLVWTTAFYKFQIPCNRLQFFFLPFFNAQVFTCREVSEAPVKFPLWRSRTDDRGTSCEGVFTVPGTFTASFGRCCLGEERTTILEESSILFFVILGIDAPAKIPNSRWISEQFFLPHSAGRHIGFVTKGIGARAARIPDSFSNMAALGA